MKLDEKDIEKVDAYLLGNLSGKELSDFELRLQDKSFADEVEGVRMVMLSAKQTILEDKMKMLQFEEEKISNESEESNPKLIRKEISQSVVDKQVIIYEAKKVRLPLKRMVGIAASVLLIGVVGWWWNEEVKERKLINGLYAEHFNPPEIPVRIVRSSSWIGTQGGYAAFKDGRYDIAGPMLEKGWEEIRDTTALYYSALAYWGDRNLIKAKELFDLDFINDENFEAFLEEMPKIK